MYNNVIGSSISDIDLTIPASYLWVVFIVVFILYVVMTAILIYHWTLYGIKGNKRIFAKGLYFLVSIILIILIMLLIGAYQVT